MSEKSSASNKHSVTVLKHPACSMCFRDETFDSTSSLRAESNFVGATRSNEANGNTDRQAAYSSFVQPFLSIFTARIIFDGSGNAGQKGLMPGLRLKCFRYKFFCVPSY
jgi:hypothetical protein